MHLSQVARRLNELHHERRATAREGVISLLPDLEAMAGTVEIDEQTRINLLVKAARLLRADLDRVDDPAAALAQLHTALGVRRGQPPIGPATTVRFRADTYELLDAVARRAGIVNASGEPRRPEVIRQLVERALAVGLLAPDPGRPRTGR